jgi:triosephosphate isomerase (TIM)
MKKIIIANWKLNPQTPREAKMLFGAIKKMADRQTKVKTIICPPTIFLPLFSTRKKSQRLSLGGQDCFWETEGAFTGQISPAMLKYAGAEYVLVGHSEKRALGDDKEILRAKIKIALESGLQVVFCLGEMERDAGGRYLDILRQQLNDGLGVITRKNYFDKILIAYEPVWAIGCSAKTAETPEDFLHNSLFIRKEISILAGKERAMKMPILYGGSVNQKNAGDFLSVGQADGLLVGRESLRPANFGIILKQAQTLA